MKAFHLCVGILVASSAISARADDLPAKLNFSRYQGIVDHSPFAVATAVLAPPATPSVCKDLYIANAAKSADGDMVTIASLSDKEFKKYLTTKEPEEGYSIVSIEWSDKVGETRVTISKDGQICTLSFNQAVLAQPMPTRPAGVTQPQPAFPRTPPAGFSTPPPHVRGVIQRNPQTQPAPPNSAED